jgi:protoporphyrinogen/coproporphyrinogen III oxidase
MRVAVVGAGIGGLAAASWLESHVDVSVEVFEGSDRVGGKLRLATVGDVTLDVGAEAMLARRPEAIELAEHVALGDRRVHPDTMRASVWTRGALRPLPRTVMGIPTDVAEAVASGILTEPPVGRSVPVPKHDVSVADYVRERAGDQVLERLVEPLLCGVYAGHADRLSLAAAGEQLKLLGPDPLASAAQVPPVDGHVFAGLDGGIGQLPGALVERLEADVHLDAVVRGVERDGATWVLHTDRGDQRYDAVVVATPAPATARLLSDVAPRAAFALADVAVASVAIVTFVFHDDIDVTGSGFLVPPVDGTSIKAATFSSSKWGWLAEPGRTVLRASVGRAGETSLLHHDDATVADAALADLRSALGRLPEPAARHVQRWGGALPQYDVGHLERLDTIDAELATLPGLEVCGATYRGVGIPAVIASAQAAVQRLVTDLGE